LNWIVNIGCVLCVCYSSIYDDRIVNWIETGFNTLDVFSVSVNPSTDNDWPSLWGLFSTVKGLELVARKCFEFEVNCLVVAKLMLNSPEKCSICVANL
jgi:hypothetical protein